MMENEDAAVSDNPIADDEARLSEEDENVKLKCELKDVQRDNDDIKCKLAELQAELRVCKLTNEESRKEISTQKTMVGKLKDENTKLEKTCKDGESVYNDLKKQVEKLLKEKTKLAKDYEAKLVNIDTELKKSYTKVDKIYKENVKLVEEKKVLQGIHKVNTELHEKLKEKENETGAMFNNIEEDINNDEEDSASEAEEDEEIEVINFFLNQQRNRASRTTPAAEAEKKKTGQNYNCQKCQYIGQNKEKLKEHVATHHMTKQVYNCTLCDQVFKTVALQRKHLKDMHNDGTNFQCESCDFQGKSLVQMQKHNKVRHSTVDIVCHFWQRGTCIKAENCPFAHPRQPPPCRYQEFCGFLPNCKFFHAEKNLCRFQAACKNEYCPFVHMDQVGQPFLWVGRKNHAQRMQPEAPMWRQW